MSFGLSNALMDLVNLMFKPYLDKFMILFIDDTLQKEQLYENFTRCEFWIQ